MNEDEKEYNDFIEDLVRFKIESIDPEEIAGVENPGHAPGKECKFQVRSNHTFELK